MKTEALIQLAQLRRSTPPPDGYCSIGDFHGGIFECDHVSPLTKSGCNVDAKIMIVGQDWSSGDVLSRDPPDFHSAEFGYDPKFPTNRNLDGLLKRHFGLDRAECYLTNLFPFIKRGKASADLSRKLLDESAKRFTLPEIRIVSPQLVICLGYETFLALTRVVGRQAPSNMDQAINSPFKFADAMIYCSAHTGARGMSNRGRDRVEEDWRQLERRLNSA